MCEIRGFDAEIHTRPIIIIKCQMAESRKPSAIEIPVGQHRNKKIKQTTTEFPQKIELVHFFCSVSSKFERKFLPRTLIVVYCCFDEKRQNLRHQIQESQRLSAMTCIRVCVTIRPLKMDFEFLTSIECPKLNSHRSIE